MPFHPDNRLTVAVDADNVINLEEDGAVGLVVDLLGGVPQNLLDVAGDGGG